MAKEKYIEAGKIVNTHGIAGELKIEVWLDSPEFMKKFKRLYIGNKEYKVSSSRVHKGHLIASLDGVADINAAMTYKGKIVKIDREDAHLEKGVFFLQDIYGAKVVDEGGKEIGELKEIIESPASNIYVISDGVHEHLIPAVPEFILSTDADEGIITVHLIEGM